MDNLEGYSVHELSELLIKHSEKAKYHGEMEKNIKQRLIELEIMEKIKSMKDNPLAKKMINIVTSYQECVYSDEYCNSTIFVFNNGIHFHFQVTGDLMNPGSRTLCINNSESFSLHSFYDKMKSDYSIANYVIFSSLLNSLGFSPSKNNIVHLRNMIEYALNEMEFEEDPTFIKRFVPYYSEHQLAILNEKIISVKEKILKRQGQLICSCDY